MEFDRFTAVFLRWADELPDIAEDELERLQQGHMAFLSSARDRGLSLAAGPFRDQEDERLRGLALFRTDIEETRALFAAEDPSVRAGRLVPELVTWLVPRGLLPA